MKTTRLLASLLAVLAFAAPVAEAATATVTNTNDSGAGSLRQAVLDESGGSEFAPGRIEFAPELNGATITLASEIKYDYRYVGPVGGSPDVGLVIDATSLPKGITLKANGTNRIFYIEDSKGVTFRGITFTRGGGNGEVLSGSGGAILVDDFDPLRVEHCTFEGNTAAQQGGAIFAGGTFSASSCTFSDNRVTGTGGKGGALVLSLDSDLVNCTFTANKAANGGAIFGAASTYTFTHCTIFRNGDGSVGAGGIQTGSSATVKLTNTIVAGNGGKKDFQELLLGDGATLQMDGMNVLQKQGAAFLIVPGVAAHVTLTDPKLKDLGDYGGRTKTMPLKSDSPVIFAATKTGVTPLDQRGYARAAFGFRHTVGAVQFLFNDPNSDTVLVSTLADELDDLGANGSGVSLREALRDVKSGATIRFAPGVFNVDPPAVIALDTNKGTLQLAKDVTIDASDCKRGVVIDGGGAVRVLEVTQPVDVKLERLTLTHGKATGGGGGGVRNFGKLKMVDCTVDACVSEKEGGAVSNLLSMTAERCTFSGNTANTDVLDLASPGGGAIANFHDLRLTNCTLSGNAARFGGAIDQNVSSLGTDPELTLLHCTVANNTATEVDAAGGIYSFYDWTMAACIVAGNRSTGGTVPDDVQNDGDGAPTNAQGLTLVGPSLVQAFHNVRGARINGKKLGTVTEVIDGLVPAGAVANLIIADPLLGSLASNGGYTFTHGLNTGSPAIDKVPNSALKTDQPGRNRAGAADLGSTEAFSFTAGKFVTAMSNTTPVPAPAFAAGPAAAAPVVLTTGDAVLTVQLEGNGGFSGSLVLVGAKYSFKGTLGSNRTATIQLTGKNLPTLTLMLTVSGPQDNELAALVSGGGIAAVTDGPADALGLSKRNPVPGYLVGSYSAVLAHGNGAVTTGFGSLTISAAGKVRCVGVLDDGTPFAFGTQLAGSDLPGDQSFSVRVPLYKKKGYVQLSAAFHQLDPKTTPYASVADGRPIYKRPAGFKDKAPASFSGGVDDSSGRFYLTPYTPPVKGQHVTIGFNETQGKGALQFQDGVIPGSQKIVLSPTGKATSIVPGLKLRLSPKTGLYAGVIPLPADPTKVFRFFGLFINSPDLGPGTGEAPGTALDAEKARQITLYPEL